MRLISTCLRLLLPTLFILAYLPPVPSAADRAKCEIDKLELCANTNELIWSDEFIAHLKQFVGDGKASWLYEDGRKSEQVISVLGGPPDKAVEFEPDLLRFSACRAHSCSEKGAAILTKNGILKAVGILHFNCKKTCSNDYTLTILTKKKNKNIIYELKKWANNNINKYNEFYVTKYGEEFRTKLELIDFIIEDKN